MVTSHCKGCYCRERRKSAANARLERIKARILRGMSIQEAKAAETVPP